MYKVGKDWGPVESPSCTDFLSRVAQTDRLVLKQMSASPLIDKDAASPVHACLSVQGSFDDGSVG